MTRRADHWARDYNSAVMRRDGHARGILDCYRTRDFARPELVTLAGDSVNSDTQPLQGALESDSHRCKGRADV